MFCNSVIWNNKNCYSPNMYSNWLFARCSGNISETNDNKEFIDYLYEWHGKLYMYRIVGETPYRYILDGDGPRKSCEKVWMDRKRWNGSILSKSPEMVMDVMLDCLAAKVEAVSSLMKKVDDFYKNQD